MSGSVGDRAGIRGGSRAGVARASMMAKRSFLKGVSELPKVERNTTQPQVRLIGSPSGDGVTAVMLDGEVLTATDADVAIAAARAAVAARRAGAAAKSAPSGGAAAPAKRQPQQATARNGSPERRERVLASALDDGRLVEQSVPAWRQRYDRDPEGTEQLLSQLASAPVLAQRRRQVAAAAAAKPPTSAPAVSSRPAARPAFGRRAPDPAAAGALFGQGSGELSQAEFAASQRARLAAAGIGSGGMAAPDDPAVAAMLAKVKGTPIGDASMSHTGPPKSEAVDPGPGKRLTRTEHGNVLYAGVPTRPSPNGGAPQVFFGDDWMDVSEFEARGLGPVDARGALAAARLAAPGARRGHTAGESLAEKVRDGMPTTSALGVI